MSLRLSSACGLLLLVAVFSWANARGSEAEAAPAAETVETDVADGQSLEDFDGNALYGNIELAKAAIEQASKQLEENPKSVRWLVARGIAHSATGDFFSALMDLEDAMAADPTSPEPHRALGYTYRVYRRPDKALPYYNKAIELGSKSVDTYMGRAAIYFEQENFEGACADYDEVIRLAPDHTMAWLGRAMLPHRDWKDAKADYDKTIELSGDAPYTYAYRARAHFHEKRFDTFCEDILAAIEQNADDVGFDYDPYADRDLTQEDLKFGEEQLRSMLRDRPQMTDWVEEGDMLWNWTLRRFAGSAGVRINWDPGSAGPAGGVSLPDRDDVGISIRAEATEGIPPEAVCDQLWSAAVFELHNCVRIASWTELNDQIDEGSIDRETFLIKSHEWEEVTCQQVRAFYIKFLVPYLAERGLAESTLPFLWSCHPAAFPADQQQLVAKWKAGHRWDGYGKGFDLRQAYRLADAEDYTGCLALIDPILEYPSSVHPQELFYAKALRARALAGLGHTDSAVEVYDQLIDEAPDRENKALVYRDRAEWLYYDGRNSEALDDITKAVAVLPDDADLRLFKAFLHEVLDETDHALAELEKGLSLAGNETRVEILTVRAQAWLEQGEYSLAHKDVDEAIKLDAHHAGSHWLRGWIHELEHNYREASADYDRAIAGGDPSLYYTESKVRLLLNKDADGVYDPTAARLLAEKLCEQAEHEVPEYLEILAQACAACGDHAQAIDHERQAMALREQWDRLNNLKRIRAYKNAGEKKAEQPAVADP